MDRKEALKYQVFCGVDVGKATNYVVALGRDDDERLVSRAVEQTETDMRAALAEATSHGVTLLVVDQPGSFGRLTVAVARDMGIDVAQIPPKRFRQVAETARGSPTRRTPSSLPTPRDPRPATWSCSAVAATQSRR